MQATLAEFGFKFPHRTNGTSNITLTSDKDSLEYTVMSSHTYPGGPVGSRIAGKWDYPQTLMPLDIQAFQYMYGADYTSYPTLRDNIYTWSPDTGEMFIDGKGQEAPRVNKIFRTVWDGGGNDTYDLSNYASAISLSLTPGESSLFSQTQRANLGNGHYAQGNVYNALLFKDKPASLIENAVGGFGNDTLRGNFADNGLNGGGGADTMTGLAGNDSYVVDNAGDTVVEAANEGADTVYVRLSYVLPANVEHAKAEEGFGNIEVRGNSDDNILSGNASDNALYGLAGADRLYGEAGNDHLDGGGGPDQMIGGTGNDTYIVDNLSDIVFEKPGEGTDTLWTSVNRGLDNDFENIVLFGSATIAGGNALNNTVSGNARGNNLYGGGGSDSLYGQAGYDRLIGEDGNDYMTGGKGMDAYYGGAGYDYAILEKGGGVDYFVDWNAAQDRVVFDSDIFSSIGAAVKAAFQNGTDVVIWDGQDGIVLQNARVADLTASNFLFV